MVDLFPMRTSITGALENRNPLGAYHILPMMICFCLIIGRRSLLAMEGVRPEVQELLDCLASDGNSPETNARVYRELSTRPDIKPDLFAALDRDYFHGAEDGRASHTAALVALQFRKDLTPSELRIITDEIGKWANNTDRRSHYNEGFIMAGIAVLRNYPSRESEDLILEFAGDKAGGISESVIETLGVIGTSRSKPALLEWRDKLARKNPQYTILKRIDGVIGAIDRRHADSNESREKFAETANTKASQSRQGEANDKSGIQVVQDNGFRGILPWLVLVLSAAGGVVWLTHRRPNDPN